MRIALVTLFTLFAAEAVAHELGVGPDDSWTSLWAAAPLALASYAYAVGMCRLWSASRLGRAVHLRRATCFGLAWLSLVIALLSPLDGLSTQLFTAHMVEHEILMVVAAPLLVLSRPLAPMLWALPRKVRSAVGRALGSSIFLFPIRKLAMSPLAATALHAVVLWLWHAPSLYTAALAEQPIHWLQHLSFFCTALLFWWALLFGCGRREYGAAIFYLFATALQSGFLGILLALARVPLYPSQGIAAVRWGLSPIEDQQLAGLIMWVPAGMVYFIAALALAALWIRGSSAYIHGENCYDLHAR
ncbi:cytochrome c oxidase assembly protein [Sinorhizobium fredii]|uniref:Cytochrome-c oxidase assembly CtaG-related protein n=1 Tax=Rhizobium fredii TaxID=380 RepID=A0A2L0HAV1_RHIFR|nr:cytochrome c oxidase assembly protein [Sinorhizobium fredii]AUX78616.1 cytochrome-c oxidase assembly CtaG-related protein [Sinorhizobium fredii]